MLRQCLRGIVLQAWDRQCVDVGLVNHTKILLAVYFL